MTKIYEDVKAALIAGLVSLIADKRELYACDLYEELYNSDTHYIYYADAEFAVEELGVWECLKVVHTYEKGHFGEVYTPLSDACRVANMIIYIMGCELLNAIYGGTIYFTEKRGDELVADDIKEMLTIAETWLKENSGGLNKIWFALPTE